MGVDARPPPVAEFIQVPSILLLRLGCRMISTMFRMPGRQVRGRLS